MTINNQKAKLGVSHVQTFNLNTYIGFFNLNSLTDIFKPSKIVSFSTFLPVRWISKVWPCLHLVKDIYLLNFWGCLSKCFGSLVVNKSQRLGVCWKQIIFLFWYQIIILRPYVVPACNNSLSLRYICFHNSIGQVEKVFERQIVIASNHQAKARPESSPDRDLKDSPLGLALFGERRKRQTSRQQVIRQAATGRQATGRQPTHPTSGVFLHPRQFHLWLAFGSSCPKN